MPIAPQNVILLYEWERQAEQKGAEVGEIVKLVPLLEQIGSTRVGGHVIITPLPIHTGFFIKPKH